MKQRKYPLHVRLITICFTLSISLPVQAVVVTQSFIDYQQLVSQRQVIDHFLAQAAQAFYAPARISSAGFTGKLPTNMEIVAENMLIAYQIEPYRADLLFSAASAYVANNDLKQAIALYEKILTIAPDDVDAHSYLAAWHRFQGNDAAFEKHMLTLAQLPTGKDMLLEQVFEIIDRVITMPIFDSVPAEKHQAVTDGPTAIVTLGYALNPDGSMPLILIERLEKTLTIARQYPNAMIAVTGGVPQNQQTEADLMAKWLVEKGIKPERIFQDNYARSTVENALYTRYALAREKIKEVVLISSGSHVRRGQGMFEIATLETGPHNVNYTVVAALDKPLADLQQASQGDIQGIYRDALKTMGLRSFRSYPLDER